MKPLFFFAVVTAITFSCCSKNNSSSSTTATSDTIPAIYKKFYNAISSLTSDGTYITIKTTNLPEHKSCYWPTSNALYEAFSGTTFGGYTFSKNPNTIQTQSITFKIPLNPKVSTSHPATDFGPIGVALNGVVFYNQYAAMYAALTTEAFTLDQYWAHPPPNGQYHYHVEPIYLTKTKFSRSAFLGFLLDGFPVYGPEENGKTLTSSDLDTYHGHITATAEYPGGIYHYHFTQDAPYLNGSGYYGTPGTVSQ